MCIYISQIAIFTAPLYSNQKQYIFVEHAEELCIIVLRRKRERPRNKHYKEKTKAIYKARTNLKCSLNIWTRQLFQALDIQRMTLKCMYGAGVASKFMNANRRYNGSDRSGNRVTATQNWHIFVLAHDPVKLRAPCVRCWPPTPLASGEALLLRSYQHRQHGVSPLRRRDRDRQCPRTLERWHTPSLLPCHIPIVGGTTTTNNFG